MMLYTTSDALIALYLKCQEGAGYERVGRQDSGAGQALFLRIVLKQRLRERILKNLSILK
jgi:hypothetical protein